MYKPKVGEWIIVSWSEEPMYVTEALLMSINTNPSHYKAEKWIPEVGTQVVTQYNCEGDVVNVVTSVIDIRIESNEIETDEHYLKNINECEPYTGHIINLK
jgi:hypothetical protein